MWAVLLSGQRRGGGKEGGHEYRDNATLECGNESSGAIIGRRWSVAER